MIETMRAAGGAGLAANQVGALLRIAVVEVDDNPRYPYKPPIPLTVLVNPEIAPLDGETARDQRGLPVGARTCAARSTATCACRVRRLDRDGAAHDEVALGPDRRHLPGTSSTTSTACCSSTASRTRARSRPGSSSSATTGTRSSSGLAR